MYTVGYDNKYICRYTKYKHTYSTKDKYIAKCKID